MKFENLLQTIGNTPLVKLNRLNINKNVNLYVKLEGQNLGGSVKDRAALYMVEQAEKCGNLRLGKIILEATSGNMGIALSVVGAQKGYRVVIVMSEGMSEERKTTLRALGAQLILTPKELGTKGAIVKARELLKTNPELYWFSDQFNNPENYLAHYHGIANEIFSEIDHVDVLIAGIGTAGTIAGLAKKFKEVSPNTKIIGVIPPPGYKIQGIQNPKKDFSGLVYDSVLLGKEMEVSDKEAYATVRRAAKTEGLLLGMSSGAVLTVALQMIGNIRKGNIVAVLADRGEKYLSTGLFSSVV